MTPDKEQTMGGNEREPVTVADYHHQQVGRAVIDALHNADPELWFDVGVAVATDKRTREAIIDAMERESAGCLSTSEGRELASLLAEIRAPMNVGKIMPEHRGGGRAGHIYVRKDPQERLGPASWLVVVQGDGEGHDSDTTQLGVFWWKATAEAFADSCRAAPAGSEVERRPVAMVTWEDVDGNPWVLAICDDGSYWQDEGSGWKRLHRPIPGTSAALYAPKEED